EIDMAATHLRTDVVIARDDLEQCLRGSLDPRGCDAGIAGDDAHRDAGRGLREARNLRVPLGLRASGTLTAVYQVRAVTCPSPTVAIPKRLDYPLLITTESRARHPVEARRK